MIATGLKKLDLKIVMDVLCGHWDQFLDALKIGA